MYLQNIEQGNVVEMKSSRGRMGGQNHFIMLGICNKNILVDVFRKAKTCKTQSFTSDTFKLR